MFNQYGRLTPRERVRLARLAIAEAEKEEAEWRRCSTMWKNLSYQPAIEEGVECSGASLPSSPVPALPLPPLPSPSGDRCGSVRGGDFERERLDRPGQSLVRSPSIEGLSYDLASATRSLHVASKRSSAASTDTFGWSSSSDACQAGEDLLDNLELAFQPQVLPYPKMKPVLSRLSTDTVSSASSRQYVSLFPPKAVPFLNTRLSVSSLSESISPSETSSSTDGDTSFVGFSTISPKSYPSPRAAMRSRRKSSLATHVIGVQPKNKTNEPTAANNGLWVEVSPCTSLIIEDEKEFNSSSSPCTTPTIARQRPESMLSDIMTFPLPPSRIKVASPSPVEVRLEDAPKLLVLGTESQSESISRNGGRDEKEGVAHGPCPPSPELSSLILHLPRPRRRRTPLSSDDEGETEESDLDVSTPLAQVALRSKILTPHSRLVSQPPIKTAIVRRARPIVPRTVSTPALKSGWLLTSGKGWSGSESEEEGWAKAVRSVKARKAQKSCPASKRSTPKPSLQVSVERTSVRDDLTPRASDFSGIYVQKRFSSISSTTATTISDTEGPLTPNLSSGLPSMSPAIAYSMSRSASFTSPGAIPNDFSWAAPFPPTSPQHQSFMIDSKDCSSLRSVPSFSSMSVLSRTTSRASRGSKRFSSKILPKPLRSVEGWGKPEVLLDDETWGEEDCAPSPLSATGFELQPAATILDSYFSSSEEEDGMEKGRENRETTPKASTKDVAPRSGMFESCSAGTGRVPSPNLWEGMGQEVGRLLDEGLDELMNDSDW
nr:hypothetical protein L204_03738 [Cryptococcus depauperatus CBS 7855]